MSLRPILSVGDHALKSHGGWLGNPVGINLITRDNVPLATSRAGLYVEQVAGTKEVLLPPLNEWPPSPGKEG